MSIPNKQKIISANNLIIAENEQKVYDAGYKEGYDTGKPEGYLDGKAESIDTIQKLIQHQVEEIDIPEGTTRLGAYCFAYCYNLKRVSIPDSVTVVDSSVFWSAGITGELVLPLACSTYHNNALSTTNFTSMKLGNAKTIGKATFADNSKCLTYDFTRNTSVPTLDIRSFQNILPDAKILVPEHLYDAWIVATNWVEWADYIEIGGIITFSIDGVEYTAKEGMTWGEWIESEYNTIGATNGDYTGDGVGFIYVGLSPIVNNNTWTGAEVNGTIEEDGSYRIL